MLRNLRNNSTALLVCLGIFPSACGSSDDPSQSAAEVNWDDCQFIAVGMHGTVACTTNESSWLSQQIEATSESLRSVAGNGAGTFVSVGDAGSVLRSSDHGATWQLAHTIENETLDAVACDGTRFIVGVNPTVVSSDSGLTWSEGGKLEPDSDAGVAIGSMTSVAPGQFIAVGKAFSGLSSWERIYATEDAGQSWSVVWSGEQAGTGGALDESYAGVASDWALNGASSESSRVVVVGTGGRTMMASGPSFTDWTAGTGVPSTASLTAVTYDAIAGRFLAGELEGGVFASEDGVSWSAACTESQSYSIADMATSGGAMLAVGPSTAVRSSDAATTCTAETPATSDGGLLLFGVTPTR